MFLRCVCIFYLIYSYNKQIITFQVVKVLFQFATQVGKREP